VKWSIINTQRNKETMKQRNGYRKHCLNGESELAKKEN
jgi:hypothetical protein